MKPHSAVKQPCSKAMCKWTPRGGSTVANYHLEVQVISRRQGRSVTKLINYISGKRLFDSYNHRTYYNRRHDVLDFQIFQPEHAPKEFYDLQALCDAIEAAELRCDARTAREFKGSLPNELPFSELQNIVSTYISANFTRYSLCSIAAIHEGKNRLNPSKNNPHVHIVVPTRTVEPTGFNKKKDREHDKHEYIHHWREQWAIVQNEAYERYGLDCRVSHESLEVQGINREPTIHLSRIDWQKEQRGEHTLAGDRKRAIELKNKAHDLFLEQIRCYDIDID